MWKIVRDKVVCDKVVFKREMDSLTARMSPSATPATQMERRCQVDVAKCHACHVKQRWMWASATPATQSAAAPRATNGDQARHQSQPSATSATPAMQMERRCHHITCLPRKTEVDVSKRHACHAKCRGAPGDYRRPSTPPEPAQCHKRHTCHANGSSMSPRATPAT